MSKRETTLTLAAADTPTTTEKDRDRAKLADLGLAGSGGETGGYVPNEDHRLDDRLDDDPRYEALASVDDDEIAQAVNTDVAAIEAHEDRPEAPYDDHDSDYAAGDKTRTHTEPKFAFVSPTDEEEADRAEADVSIFSEGKSVRAFAYHEGPCGATIVSAPTETMDEADGSERLTVIESPLAGNVSLNIAYAKLAMLDCFERGEAPFASHLLYAQGGLLDDADPIERGRGIVAGFAWARYADRCAVYTDLGISPGMGLGIASAQSYGIRIEFRTLGEDVVRDLMDAYGRP